MASAGPRVMIIEDAEDIRMSMAQLLQAEGYDVRCAGDGHRAFELLSSSSELPDVIILDLMMPDMDGFEFRARQKADVRLSRIPVVLMTAGGDIQAKARQLDARAYLKKPFRDVQTILETVGRVFK